MLRTSTACEPEAGQSPSLPASSSSPTASPPSQSGPSGAAVVPARGPEPCTGHTDLRNLLPWLLWTERLLASLLAGAAVTAVALLSFLPWRVFAALFIIPSAFLLLATFGLPPDPFPGDTGPGRQELPRLKVSSLLAVGLCPFVVWWLSAPGNSYLTAVASAAVVSAAWCLMEVNGVLRRFFRCFGCRRAELLALASRELSFYGVLLPVLVINGLFAWGCLTMPNIAIPDLPRIWQATPRWLLLIMLVPAVLTGILAWKARMTMAGRVRPPEPKPVMAAN